jgi:hypothetical protein
VQLGRRTLRLGNRETLPREGKALLQGRVLCGVCGTRMSVKYQEPALGLVPYYQCCEDVVRNAGKMCQSIRGGDVDQAISDLLLETVAPAALEVALAVQDEIILQQPFDLVAAGTDQGVRLLCPSLQFKLILAAHVASPAWPAADNVNALRTTL